MKPELEEWYRSELSRKRDAYERGFLNAMWDALKLCHQRDRDRLGYNHPLPWDQVEIPRWLLEAVARELHDAVGEILNPTPRPKHRRRIEDLTKWERSRREYKQYERGDVVQCFLDSHGCSRREAYEKASEASLDWLGEHVGVDAMRAAHEAVEERFASIHKRGRKVGL